MTAPSPETTDAPDPASPTSRFRRVDELFLAALERSSEDRAACLDDVTPALREEVMALLAAHGEAGEFLRAPAVEAPREGADPRVGRTLGPYRLTQCLGRGGMGSVYRARRVDGAYDGEVAIKLLDRRTGNGTDGRESLAERRFLEERRILARLDDPRIARLLDAGTDADGSPYLVMELVDGTPLDVAARDLDLPARLELILAVCDAVIHAHRRLIVHRDLKPANILVDADGRPKLLDFGIAKLLDAGETGPREGRPMTPSYASPEQLRGEAIGLGTDVYALGVVLYELLTGRLPRVFRSLDPADVERILATIPETASLFDRRLAGDLDAILAKALEADPARRYGSVEELAADLRRHVDGFPVVARNGGPLYRLGKTLRRRRRTVAATAAAFVVIVGFSAALGLQSRELARERDRARAESATAQDVGVFLADLLARSDPWDVADGGTTLREILDRGTAAVLEGYGDRPEVRAGLLRTLGAAYLELGDTDAAEPLLEEAVALRRTGAGSEIDLAETLTDLGRLRLAQSRYDAARKALLDAYVLRSFHLPADDLRLASSLRWLAHVLFREGAYDAALGHLRQALEIHRAAGPGKDVERAEIEHDLARVHWRRGDLAAAAAWARSSHDRLRPIVGEAHPAVTSRRLTLALVLRDLGDLAQAESLAAEMIETAGEETHHDPILVRAFYLLAAIRSDQGADDAVYLAREALVRSRRTFGERHHLTALAAYALGSLTAEDGRPEVAEPLLRTSLTTLREILVADHPDIAHVLLVLGDVLVEKGEAAAAEPLLSEAREILHRRLPTEHWELALADFRLGRCLTALGREDVGAPLVRSGRAGLADAPEAIRRRELAEPHEP